MFTIQTHRCGAGRGCHRQRRRRRLNRDSLRVAPALQRVQMGSREGRMRTLPTNAPRLTARSKDYQKHSREAISCSEPQLLRYVLDSVADLKDLESPHEVTDSTNLN